MRRAKLYYLRGRVGKRARVRERRNTGPEEAVQRELLYGAQDDEGQDTEAQPDELDVAQPGADVQEEPAPADVQTDAETATEPQPAGAEESGAEESEESASSTAPQDAEPAEPEDPAGKEKE